MTPEPPDDIDDDLDGYSEGAEDFSCGIEMPISMMGGATEQSSGNVTPIPTQGINWIYAKVSTKNAILNLSQLLIRAD